MAQNSLYGYKSLFGQQQELTAEEKMMAEEDKLRIEQERLELKQREKGMQGGGRKGLMFGGNEQGVV